MRNLNAQFKYICVTPFGFVKLHFNRLLMQFILHYEKFHVNYLYVDCIIESSLNFHPLYNFRNLQPKLHEETQKLKKPIYLGLYMTI